MFKLFLFILFISLLLLLINYCFHEFLLKPLFFIDFFLENLWKRGLNLFVVQARLFYFIEILLIKTIFYLFSLKVLFLNSQGSLKLHLFREFEFLFFFFSSFLSSNSQKIPQVPNNKRVEPLVGYDETIFIVIANEFSNDFHNLHELFSLFPMQPL